MYVKYNNKCLIFNLLVSSNGYAAIPSKNSSKNSNVLIVCAMDEEANEFNKSISKKKK